MRAGRRMPYQQARRASLRQLRRHLKRRHVSIGQVFGFMDAKRSNAVDYQGFKSGLRLAGIHLEEGDLDELHGCFELNERGELDFAGFKRSLGA